MSDEKQKPDAKQKPRPDSQAKPAGLGPLYLAMLTGAFLLLGDVFQVFLMWQAKARLGVALLMTAITLLMARDQNIRIYCGVVIWVSLALTFWL